MSQVRRFFNVQVSMNSVFARCVALLSAATITVAGIMTYEAIITINRMAEESVVDQATQVASLKSSALAKPLRFKVMPQIVSVLDQTSQTAGGTFVAAEVYDGQGTMLSKIETMPPIDEDGAPVAPAAEMAQEPVFHELAALVLETGGIQSELGGLRTAHPVLVQGSDRPLGVLVLELSSEAALQAVAAPKRKIVVAGVVAFVAMVVIVAFVLSRILGRPLGRLGRAIGRVAEGDYETEVSMTKRRDEIGAIAREFAVLVDRLHDAKTAEEKREELRIRQAAVVAHLGEGLDALARGVLSYKLNEPFTDEYEALRENYNRAVVSLNEALSDVLGSAESINNGVQEMARASEDLSQRTETQAATLEQTAAALDQLATSVRGAAQSAANADGVVSDTREKASRNDDVMRSAVTAMAEIEKSSEQISEIIGVIDDIAFQTNLLALNAGVEAARAGASGKGFAVVASEVRALAKRSSDAARQIKDLISGSSDQVKTGVKLVESAGAALEEVVTSIGEVSDLVSGMAKGASTQAQGLNEINSGVSNLDQVTQHNAAMVEESTAAVHSLRGDAANLTRLVNRFQISEEEAYIPERDHESEDDRATA